MVMVQRLSQAEAVAALDDLARLRIAVFRDFPYLYDGDLDYERRYLRAWMEAPDAVLIAARDGNAMVGAATASPLKGQHEEFALPFAEHGLHVDSFFYFGESVLLPAYRGQGVGVRFFEEREAAANDLAFKHCIFAAVRRPDDHPARPAGYVSLERFWAIRGYRRMEGLITRFSWRDVGEQHESAKPMDFWSKTL